MADRSDEITPALPGLGPVPAAGPGAPGYVEAATVVMVDKLRADGWISDWHAGPVALAIVTARRVDASEGRGAPSGQANLLRAMKEIFELLPTPESVSSDALDKALAFMMSGDGADAGAPA